MLLLPDIACDDAERAQPIRMTAGPSDAGPAREGKTRAGGSRAAGSTS